jgi:hypothetical protein
MVTVRAMPDIYYLPSSISPKLARRVQNICPCLNTRCSHQLPRGCVIEEIARCKSGRICFQNYPRSKLGDLRVEADEIVHSSKRKQVCELTRINHCGQRVTHLIPEMRAMKPLSQVSRRFPDPEPRYSSLPQTYLLGLGWGR